ncbi:MAG: hypothetical protein IJ279_00385 [Clostridia bacterium]|nr:hypothetical protein [Clostridia bacterium]
MAKKKEKNTAKSLAMVLITGITLVAATLCWFAIMDRSVVEPIKRAEVKNESSTFANIYYGADASNKIAITPESIKQYIKIESREIILENMFPGAEYTYMAEFSNARKDMIITLDLNDIANVTGTLTSKVKLNRRVTLMSGVSGDKETTSTEPSYKLQAGEILLSDENTFTYKVPADGRYRVYFSFKIDETVTVENGRNMSINIENVDAVISNS